MSLVVDPAFATNGYVYVYYTPKRTHASQGGGVIARFQHADNNGGMTARGDLETLEVTRSASFVAVAPSYYFLPLFSFPPACQIAGAVD